MVANVKYSILNPGTKGCFMTDGTIQKLIIRINKPKPLKNETQNNKMMKEQLAQAHTNKRTLISTLKWINDGEGAIEYGQFREILYLHKYSLLQAKRQIQTLAQSG